MVWSFMILICVRLVFTVVIHVWYIPYFTSSLYVLISVLWYLLRFPHKTMLGSSLPPVVYGWAHVLFSCLCLFTCGGVWHVLCFSTCCQILQLFHFWLPLRYSRTFAYEIIFQIYRKKIKSYLKWVVEWMLLSSDEQYFSYIAARTIDDMIMMSALYQHG